VLGNGLLALDLIDLVLFLDVLRSEFLQLSVCAYNIVLDSFDDALKYRGYIASNDRAVRE
jgi:hypothetical protein